MNIVHFYKSLLIITKILHMDILMTQWGIRHNVTVKSHLNNTQTLYLKLNFWIVFWNMLCKWSIIISTIKTPGLLLNHIESTLRMNIIMKQWGIEHNNIITSLLSPIKNPVYEYYNNTMRNRTHDPFLCNTHTPVNPWSPSWSRVTRTLGWRSGGRDWDERKWARAEGDPLWLVPGDARCEVEAYKKRSGGEGALFEF